MTPKTAATLPAQKQDRTGPHSGRQKARTASTDEKRERILQAAEVLFDTQGYTNTSLEQIVQRLGVTKPYVYYYFHNKLEIYETLCWRPIVACYGSMDFPKEDQRPAHEKIMEGVERLIRITIEHYPAAFFPYREPQVFRPEYLAMLKKQINHFYDRMCVLMEQARNDGMLEFTDTRVTAMAACSLPGFLYAWYRPDGRLSPAEMVRELTELALRVLGLRGRYTEQHIGSQ